jgi:predicted branched-subunit amino acid permease
MQETLAINLKARALQGMYAMLPLLPGIIPFGLIAGFTPVSFGYTWLDSWMGSLLMFAGASQLAAYQLMNEGASIWVILLTVAAINLRYVLYSASIAPYFVEANRTTRLLAGYGLTDQIYAVCHRDYPTQDWNLHERVAYYTGGTLLLWSLWQACTVIGAFVGQIIPVFWSLEFMIPLTFLALALNTLKTRAHQAAAMTGAIVSLLGLDLPYNLGLIFGGLIGIVAGVLFKRFSQ